MISECVQVCGGHSGGATCRSFVGGAASSSSSCSDERRCRTVGGEQQQQHHRRRPKMWTPIAVAVLAVIMMMLTTDSVLVAAVPEINVGLSDCLKNELKRVTTSKNEYEAVIRGLDGISDLSLMRWFEEAKVPRLRFVETKSDFGFAMIFYRLPDEKKGYVCGVLYRKDRSVVREYTKDDDALTQARVDADNLNSDKNVCPHPWVNIQSANGDYDFDELQLSCYRTTDRHSGDTLYYFDDYVVLREQNRNLFFCTKHINDHVNNYYPESPGATSNVVHHVNFLGNSMYVHGNTSGYNNGYHQPAVVHTNNNMTLDYVNGNLVSQRQGTRGHSPSPNRTSHRGRAPSPNTSFSPSSHRVRAPSPNRSFSPSSHLAGQMSQMSFHNQRDRSNSQGRQASGNADAMANNRSNRRNTGYYDQDDNLVITGGNFVQQNIGGVVHHY